MRVRPAVSHNALDIFKPYYESLFGYEQWSDKAKAYFNDVTNNRNRQLDYPFEYSTEFAMQKE